LPASEDSSIIDTMTKAGDLREKYLSFFEKRGHTRIPSSSLVPENDPTTLFTGSGMQSLMPYLLGEKHPLGTRLTNSQLCFRAQDIEEVGDNRHTTFFEMLGNWSLGDYYKKDQLTWFFEFLTKEAGLDSQRLYVSVFDGNWEYKVFCNDKYQPLAPDLESIKIWGDLFGIKKYQTAKNGFDPKVKIYCYGVDKNWWSRAGTPSEMPAGEIGGPDSEVFYDFGAELKLHENSPYADQVCHLNCNCGRFLEIGNSVFMEYRKTSTGVLTGLPKRNVDFGGGLERILAAEHNQPDIFKTELFWPMISEIVRVSGRKYQNNEAAMRVVVDHLKAAIFMAEQNLEPSNKGQGYVMRRLIRRSVVKMMTIGIAPLKIILPMSNLIKEIYGDSYFHKQPRELQVIISDEIDDFLKNISKWAKALKGPIDGKILFDLYQSCGVPLEISQELLKQWNREIPKQEMLEFEKLKKEHQEKSRTAAECIFKGGLADHSEAVTRLHTVTHLLHQALRDVLGSHIRQVGSNITAQRLRFDFSHSEKLTEKQIKKVEEIINEKIDKNLPVVPKTMTLKEAKKQGALAFFTQKYSEKVKVYSIGNYSCEVCGGPHVANTSEIGRVKIRKQESIGAGRRRFYAVIECLPNGS